MIILKYNEKPEDWETRYYNTERLDYAHSESDVMWYTDDEYMQKRISEMQDEKFLKELMECFKEWLEIAKAAEDYYMPLKYVYVDFWTNEGRFALYPSDLGGGISDIQFEEVVWKIVDKLEEMGVVKVRYNGMMD